MITANGGYVRPLAAQLHHVWCMGVSDARAGREPVLPTRSAAKHARYLEGYLAGQSMEPYPLTRKQREMAVASDQPLGYDDEPSRGTAAPAAGGLGGTEDGSEKGRK